MHHHSFLFIVLAAFSLLLFAACDDESPWGANPDGGDDVPCVDGKFTCEGNTLVKCLEEKWVEWRDCAEQGQVCVLESGHAQCAEGGGDADGDGDGDGDGDSDGDGDGDTDADGDGDGDGDADGDTDSDGDTDADSDTDMDTDTDADTDSDADTDADTDSDGDSDTDTDADTDSDSDTATGSDNGTRVLEYDFATCPSGWSGAGNNSDWECGSPISGPNADHSGDGNLWGTGLAGDATACQDSSLTSPVIDLSSHSGKTVTLRFWHWHYFRECVEFCSMIPDESYSGGAIEVSTGGAWTPVTPEGGYGDNGYVVNCWHDGHCGPTVCSLDGESDAFNSESFERAWYQTVLDISAYTASSFQVRFVFGSHADAFGGFPQRPGWYIDDVEVWVE